MILAIVVLFMTIDLLIIKTMKGVELTITTIIRIEITINSIITTEEEIIKTNEIVFSNIKEVHDQTI